MDNNFYKFNYEFEPADLFLRLDPQVVLKPGDRIEWSGDLPEGKTQLWVRYKTVLDMGTAPLKDSDRYTLGGEPSREGCPFPVLQTVILNKETA